MMVIFLNFIGTVQLIVTVFDSDTPRPVNRLTIDYSLQVSIFR